MQTVRPAATGHQATGKLINNNNFAILHHILLISQEQAVRTQRRIQVMNEQDVRRFVQASAFR